MTKRSLLPLALASLALAGCGPADEPETRSIEVTIFDPLPLQVYFNQDDVVCTTRGFGAENRALPEITVADGAGEILAVEEGPELGGRFEEGVGCTVDVTFTGVPAADIYRVQLESQGSTWSTTIDDTQAGGLEAEVAVDG